MAMNDGDLIAGDLLEEKGFEAQAIKLKGSFMEIGKCYMIRAITFFYVGRVVEMTAEEILLEKASWVASTGRWHTALANGTLDEVEPYPNRCVVMRQSIIDYCEWDHPLPESAQ